MTIPRYAAHSPGPLQPAWEDQRTHRERVVAALARSGVTAGLSAAQAHLHDLGKYHPAFQAYIRASAAGLPATRAPHAAHGAVMAQALAWHWPGSRVPEHLGVLLAAAPILAHHTGLKDAADMRKALSEPATVQGAKVAWAEAITDGHPDVPALAPLVQPPAHLDLLDGTQVDLMTRMLTSLLVDADWIATEVHYRPHLAAQRRRVELPDVVARFAPGRLAFLRAQQARKARTASAAVQQVRDEVHHACEAAGAAAARTPQRLFRLTVPTGGGKTLASVAFALALVQARAGTAAPVSRVVMAVPLTSITDQNAEVLRAVLGADAVLEHHSALDLQRRAEQPLHLRLASETWDAPVIVTTTVQAIEVLGAAEPGRLRRLHRLRGSVLILDEVQGLPTHLLTPIMALLREASQRHDVTVVLCSATQPPFELERRLDLGDVQEINADYERHFALLRRVTYHWLGELNLDALRTQLLGTPQVLAVLNTRRDAVRVLQALGTGEGHYHLSTLLCPAHRQQVRAAVDARLAAGQPVRLVSTTVIEAGVDISFPRAYRQTAGLERAQQVAGRVNRDGEGSGAVFLFDLTGGSDGPPGGYALATRQARELYQDLARQGEAAFSDALHDPGVTHRYFRNLLADPALDLDERDIQAQRRAFNLRTVSDRFRLIDDVQLTVLVPFDARARRLIAAARRKLDRRGVLTGADRQRLQPYAVQIRERDLSRLPLIPLHEDLFTCPPSAYDPLWGLRLHDLQGAS